MVAGSINCLLMDADWKETQPYPKKLCKLMLEGFKAEFQAYDMSCAFSSPNGTYARFLAFLHVEFERFDVLLIPSQGMQPWTWERCLQRLEAAPGLSGVVCGSLLTCSCLSRRREHAELNRLKNEPETTVVLLQCLMLWGMVAPMSKVCVLSVGPP